MLQNKAKLSNTAKQSKAELSCWQRRPHLHEKTRTTRDEAREAETRQTGRKTRDARRKMHVGRTTDIKTQARTKRLGGRMRSLHRSKYQSLSHFLRCLPNQNVFAGALVPCPQADLAGHRIWWQSISSKTLRKQHIAKIPSRKIRGSSF